MTAVKTLLLPDGDQALHERLATALVVAIDDGAFKPGERLPTHRRLAERFGVSIGTVTRAVDTLSDRGLVRGEIGRGTFVLERAAPSDANDIVDLTINAPPPLLGYEALAEAAEIATRRALRLGNGGYVDHSGTDTQRGVIAAWLTGTRQTAMTDEIVLTNGAQQGIHLAFAALKDRSATIATEGATFPGAISAAANLGLAMLPVLTDAEGMMPDALDAVLAANQCKIIYTTPVCQNPLGFETGPERRRAISAVAAKNGAVIVEDDIYGLYAAKGRLTYKDIAPEGTIFVTSLSKSLTPLVRLGVMVPPRPMRAGIIKRMRAESWGLPPFVAELSAALIETGAATHVEGQLRDEALVRQLMAQQILNLASLPMPKGAPHIWLPMSPLAAERLARRASEAKVRITPPGATQVGASSVGGVRLCIMAPPTRSGLERGLTILAGLLGSEEDVIV
ncbi:DNA-binding transcriptional MocR family regulator [Devosia sp. UYZn731]|uniref:aminotransferase-like domain-containing protein n=1 Tax=Devosia sp. UYZn731 TaxID=3156345 RepID=UPI0033908807